MRKKLNSKGFTLVELLAVIVILALIMVIAIPQILNTLSSARVNSLHVSAQGVAKWYPEVSVSDSMRPSTEMVIPLNIYDRIKLDGKWYCMTRYFDSTSGKDLLKLAGLSDADVNGKVNGTDVLPFPTDGIPSPDTVNQKTCSAIKFNSDGSVEVLLVAKEGGKYFNNGEVTYAYSKDAAGTKFTP